MLGFLLCLAVLGTSYPIARALQLTRMDGDERKSGAMPLVTWNIYSPSHYRFYSLLTKRKCSNGCRCRCHCRMPSSSAASPVQCWIISLINCEEMRDSMSASCSGGYEFLSTWTYNIKEWKKAFEWNWRKFKT